MKPIVGIIGLGYVGLPLAIALAEHFKVFGYDTDATRIASLQAGIDNTKEVTEDELKKTHLNYSNLPQALNDCTVYIVTVPTPLKDQNLPDFTPLKMASKMLAKMLTKGNVVVYESTVYPGATEEICVPVLETSGLTFNQDFFVGYSPERINLGDKYNTFKTIPKIVSASDTTTLTFLKDLYQTILTAEVYCAPSIKVAEAAKVIENTQRDINIAFVNELAMAFKAMGLDTREVLEAASTKWNFLNFSPGLVGGHCIGIDPYYLAHKSEALGYIPNLLLSARKVNEEIPYFIVRTILEKLKEHQVEIFEAKVLLLGATFKENTTDIRNSKALTIAFQLQNAGVALTVHDPNIEKDQKGLAVEITPEFPAKDKFDVVILAVEHLQFSSIDPLELLTDRGFVYDVKAFFGSHPRIYRL